MEISQSEIKGFSTIEISGEIDLSTSPQLRSVFIELLDGGKVKFLVNFEKVSYIDSSGLATLIEMMQRLKAQQGTMYLVQLSDKVRSLFEITKLDKLFQILPTQEDALIQAGT